MLVRLSAVRKAAEQLVEDMDNTVDEGPKQQAIDTWKGRMANLKR
jgi:hypothetical protein